jgi:hypothetical protein
MPTSLLYRIDRSRDLNMRSRDSDSLRAAHRIFKSTPFRGPSAQGFHVGLGKDSAMPAPGLGSAAIFLSSPRASEGSQHRHERARTGEISLMKEIFVATKAVVASRASSAVVVGHQHERRQQRVKICLRADTPHWKKSPG